VCPRDAEVFGEIESKIVGDRFVDKIVPVRQRSADEIARMRAQADEHKEDRAKLYKKYSFAERLRDLSGKPN
jgi:hypothetical protein